MRADLLLTRLAASLALALSCLGASSPALADSPTTELRIAVGLLRSQAAELELLQAESLRGGVPRRTVRGHAIQLGRAVKRSRERLDKAPAPAAAEQIREDAQAAAQRLAALLLALSTTGSTGEDAAAVLALRDRLLQDEAALPH